MSKDMQKVFCITHFFNPVRYMRLLELVITSMNDRNKIEELKIFLYWCIKDSLLKKMPKQSRNFWNEFSKYLRSSRTGSMFLLGELTCFIQRSKMTLIIFSSKVVTRPKIK